MVRNNIYFALKPYLPDRIRTFLRKWYSRRALGNPRAEWPIDEAAGRTPLEWPGWPGGKQFAVVLTHDVEASEGLRKTMALAAIEENLGFRSSFNFVPEGDYRLPAEVREQLNGRGFEIGVHDLHHDGHLYASRASFRASAQRINQHLREWGAAGFRSAFMLHRLEWLHDLEIQYDASTFDTDPIEPQPDAATTIFPYWVGAPAHGTLPANGRPGSPTRPNGFVELPYTLPQDSTLFLFLGHKDIDVWKKKVEWIAERGGMVLLNLHPDYVSHGESRGIRKDYPARFYQEFLEFLRDRFGGAYWHALPRDVARFVRESYPQGGPRRPRHACMLSYSFFEQDNRVQRYAKALAMRGDTVDVLTLRPAAKPSAAPTDTQGSPASPYHFMPGVRVHHIQDRVRDEKGLMDFARRMITFFAKSSRVLDSLWSIRRFDVVHVHNVPDFLVFAAWLVKRRGSRIILDLHDLLPEFYCSKFDTHPDSLLFRVLLLGERLSCRFADHVIVSNHLWRDKVAQRVGLSDRCTAMVNHVDTEPYLQLSARRRNDASLHRPAIAAFPGGFYRHQGLHVAIEALAKVRQRVPDAELHLVGDGPERQRLLDMVERLELRDAVRILPSIPIRQVPEFLSRADIGIVPKLADGFGNEAYSTKIMEFMAAGLPVLASSTKIDRYYFGNGEVRFFESGNPEDMSRAWIDLLENPDSRSGLVRKGFDYVDSHGWVRNAAEYLELFDRLSSEA